MMALAREFSRVLTGWLSPAERHEVLRLNRVAAPGVCHTQDFCDANEAMTWAFRRLFGREPDPMSDADSAQWNGAWDAARRADFWWGAECPNCRRWSSAWAAGEFCPECANGADRARQTSGWANKVLEPIRPRR